MIETGQRGRNMAVRTKLVAGNWKMNGLREDGVALARALVHRMVAAGAGGPGCELLVCPPATLLTTVGGLIAGSGIALGGQDCHAAAKGAFTGDISPEMLADAGCTHVILGHSERRHGHGEDDTAVHGKILGAPAPSPLAGRGRAPWGIGDAPPDRRTHACAERGGRVRGRDTICCRSWSAACGVNK